MGKVKMNLRGKLAGLLALAGLGLLAKPSLALAQSAPPSQCVAVAQAGGTADALTVPALPCGVTTTLLILTLSATNATTTPTLQILGGPPAETIVEADGSALAGAELQAGATVLLTNNGVNWRKLAAGRWPDAPSFAVANNVALNALPVSVASLVSRCGVVAANDSSCLSYSAGGSQCTLDASVTGSVTGTALTVSALLSGQALHPGMVVSGGTIPANTVIVAGSGSTGAFTLNHSATTASTTLSIYGDGGSQIPSADGKCWNAVWPAQGLDPKWFGALGNQVADDTASIQNAVSIAGAIGAKTEFGAGNYCVKTGPVIASGTGQIIGGSRGVEVQTCNADSKVFELNARGVLLENLTVAGCCFGQGMAGLSTTNYTIGETAACVECKLQNVQAVGGQYVLDVQSGDGTADDFISSNGYAGLVYIHGPSSTQYASLYCKRCKEDQNTPLGTFPAYGTSFSAWASCSSYTEGTIVTVETGGTTWLIQAMNSGKSGNSTPTLANYGQTIQDDAAGCSGGGSNQTWQLVAQDQMTSTTFGNYVSNYWEINSDHTGLFGYAWLSDTGGGSNGPQATTIESGTCGEVRYGCFNAADGGNLIVHEGIWSNCVLTGCYGLRLGGNWQGDTSVSQVTMQGLGYGVLDEVGVVQDGVLTQAGLNVSGSIFGNMHVAALYASGNTGTTTVTITIASPGVVTWTANGFSTTSPQPVEFTTNGALPTGLTAGTIYWTVPASVTANTFEVATTYANALAGTAVNTSGSQSGTQTGTAVPAMGFDWSHNQLNSAVWGSNVEGAKVKAGLGDYYSIVNNLCGGAVNCIDNGGTGSHTNVANNN